MTPDRLRAVRWTSAAIVFQGALHALNPVQRVGDQIDEAILLHSSAEPRRGRAGAPSPCSSGSAWRRCGRARIPTSSRVGNANGCSSPSPWRASRALLIADEPTTALDVMVQAQVLALLAELQRDQGLAMLFITHDLSLLTTTCRRLAIMYAGRIVEEGPSDEVFSDGLHPYSRALARAFPTDRRPGVADGTEWPARRSTQSGRPARRVPVRTALRRRHRRVPRRSTSPCAAAATRGVRHVSTSEPSMADRRPAARSTTSTSRSPAGTAPCAPSTASASTSAAARSSPSSASPAAARRRCSAPCSGSNRSRPGSCPSRASPWSTRSRPAARFATRGADGVPGPDGRAQPPAHGVRGGRRGDPHPRARRRRGRSSSPMHSAGPGCGRPSGSSVATRTRSRVGSASAC